MKIFSSEFKNNESMPKKYTCDGEDINPPLEFSEVPENAKSMALIVDDPDAVHGTWVHWVMWNIDAGTKKIEENSVPPNAVEGVTSYGKPGYGGPCPPSGTHRYFFKAYALDIKLDISGNADVNELKEAMKGHIIDNAEIIGLYRR